MAIADDYKRRGLLWGAGMGTLMLGAYAIGRRQHMTEGAITAALAGGITYMVMSKPPPFPQNTTRYQIRFRDGHTEQFETSDPSTIPTTEQLPAGSVLTYGWDRATPTGDYDLNVHAQLRIAEPSRHWKRY